MNDSYDVIALYMLNFTTFDMEILRYTYDNMERLLTTSVERDGAEPVLLCSNTYDELGRLATQSLGGSAEKVFVNYLFKTLKKI